MIVTEERSIAANLSAVGASGVELLRKGSFISAQAVFSSILEVNPGCVKSLVSIAQALSGQGLYRPAMTFYQRALALDPNLVQALVNLGIACNLSGLISRGVDVLVKALELSPASFEGLVNLARALLESGEGTTAALCRKRALHIDPDNELAVSDYLVCLNYGPGLTQQEIFEEHRKWSARLWRPNPVFPARVEQNLQGLRIRVGYLSPDFRRHPVGYFFLPVLREHDPEIFETFCYSLCMREDDLTAELKRHSGHWLDMAAESDRSIAQRVYADKIDVLVDLAGHTRGGRPGVFSLRPARTQIGWLGYFNTTGLKSLDYAIMDAHTVPGGGERYFSEKVVRLPRSRFCWQSPGEVLKVAPAPCLGNGRITFGSFNNLSKISADVVRLWSLILKRVPGSRLVVKWRTLDDGWVKRRMADMFAAHGIAGDALDLRGPSSWEMNLIEYEDIDICLDTFPFSGCLTSCEALWMGVPVVTRPGLSPVSRQTYAILSAIGLGSLCAGSDEEYVRIASELAFDFRRLSDLRANLRRMVGNSVICDGPGFTREYEAALLDVCLRSDPSFS